MRVSSLHGVDHLPVTTFQYTMTPRNAGNDVAVGGEGHSLLARSSLHSLKNGGKGRERVETRKPNLNVPPTLTGGSNRIGR